MIILIIEFIMSDIENDLDSYSDIEFYNSNIELDDSDNDFDYDDEDDGLNFNFINETKNEFDRRENEHINSNNKFLSKKTIKVIMNDLKDFDLNNFNSHGIFYGELPDVFNYIDLYLRFDNESKLGEVLNKNKKEKVQKLIDSDMDKEYVTMISNDPDNPELTFSDCLKIRVEFDDEYPLKAPFTRIISPTVRTINHHFAVFGGALCFNFLSKYGVNPTQHFHDIIMSVKPLLEINLEIENINGIYSREGAIEGYNRINTAHRKW